MALEGTDGLALSRPASWRPQKNYLPGRSALFSSTAEPSRADRRSADRPALYTLTPDRPLAAYYWYHPGVLKSSGLGFIIHP